MHANVGGSLSVSHIECCVNFSQLVIVLFLLSYVLLINRRVNNVNLVQ